MRSIYTKKDIGCYADGANGEKHRQIILSELVSGILPRGSELTKDQNAMLDSLLTNTPSDDYSEENDAIEILQSVTDDGLVWVMESGDLLLIRQSDNL